MAKKWIQKAIKHPGALHRALHVPEGEKIPAKKLAKAAKSDNPTLARRANLAKTLGHMHHAHQPHPKTNPGEYDNEAHGPAPQGGSPHTFRPPATSGACGYGHSGSQCHGALRMSGTPGAHRIGKR